MQMVDLVSALAILWGAASIVAVAIVVAQRLERGHAEASGTSAADERLADAADLDLAGLGLAGLGRAVPGRAGSVPAGDDPVLACRTPSSSATSDGHPGDGAGSLVIRDDAFTAAPAIEPWRAATPADLSEIAGRPLARSHAWTRSESDDLVDAFRDGFRLETLADELDVHPCAVVEELGRRAFGAVEPVADVRTRRFGQCWTIAELRALHSGWAARLSVPDIARQLGRDQLSVVFRLLESAAEERAMVDGSVTRASLLGAQQEAESATAGVSADPAEARAAQVREVAFHG